MRTGVLFSGGKDSCLAMHKFGIEKVDVLLVMVPETMDSWMFHTPNLELIKKQAEMLEKKLIIEKTKGEKDKELADLRNLLKKSKVNRLVIGGLASNYQGNRIKKICSDLNIEVIAPLWTYTAEKLWTELINLGFKVILTKISCEGIGKEWLGKVIDKTMFDKLEKLSERYKFRLDFEGGEAESAVLYMPGFKKELKTQGNIKSEGKYRHFLNINNIKEVKT